MMARSGPFLMVTRPAVIVSDGLSVADGLRLIDATSNAGGFGPAGDWASNEKLRPTAAENIEPVANVRFTGTSQPWMLHPRMIGNEKRRSGDPFAPVITRHYATTRDLTG